MMKSRFASVASVLFTATIGFGIAAGVSGCTGANPAAYVCPDGQVWSNPLQDCVVKMPAGQMTDGGNNHIGSICMMVGQKNMAEEVCLPKNGSDVVIVDGIWTSEQLVWSKITQAALAINAQQKSWSTYQSVPFTFVDYTMSITTGTMSAGKWRVFDANGAKALWTTRDPSFINFPVRKWSGRSYGEGCNGTQNGGECTLP